MEDANKNRVHELIAQIAAEKDHDKFTALVAELNRLLDSGQTVQRPPAHNPLK
jgi:hypothetical protein